jgi:hypothetical protein
MNGRSGAWATGALILAAGLLWLADAADWIELDVRTWIGLLLVGIGAVLVVDRRASHGLLVFAAVVLILVGIPLAAIDTDVLEGGIGERTEEPLVLGGEYRLGIGRLVVDLTQTDLRGGELEASVGIGELVVEVPPEVSVRVDGHAGIGNLQLFDEQEGGVDVDLDAERFVPGAPPVVLDVSVGIGNVEVREGF